MTILSLMGVFVLSPASGSRVRGGDDQGGETGPEPGRVSAGMVMVADWGSGVILGGEGLGQTLGGAISKCWSGCSGAGGLASWVSLEMGREPRPVHMLTCLALRGRS